MGTLPPSPPPKSLPAMTGENELGGSEGNVEALTMAVEVANADLPMPFAFACAIGGVTVEAVLTANGPLAFAFPTGSLGILKQGEYPIEVSSAGNGYNHAVGATAVGRLTVGAPIPTT